MTHDRSCLSQLLHWCSSSRCPGCVWERKGLLPSHINGMRWFFDLMSEARLSSQLDQWPCERSRVRADQQSSLLLCTHRNVSQVVGSVLLVVSFNCLNHQRFYLTGPGAKLCVLVVTLLLLAHLKGEQSFLGFRINVFFSLSRPGKWLRKSIFTCPCTNCVIYQHYQTTTKTKVKCHV